jgi:hypothetical protein
MANYVRPKVTFVSTATYKGNKALFETESLKSLNNSIDPAQNISAQKQFNWNLANSMNDIYLSRNN